MRSSVSQPRERVRSGDTSIDRRGRRLDVPPILSYGFRPFFLAGALYAALSIPLWLAALFFGDVPTGVFVGAAWHAHEMIFGYLGAVMAGFILTAVPNWTGRFPISGARLLILLITWTTGRVIAFVPAEPAVAAVIDLAFPVMLAGAIWREIAAGRNYRNIPVAALVSLFAAANLLDYLGSCSPDAWRLRRPSRSRHRGDLDSPDRRAHHTELHPQLDGAWPDAAPARPHGASGPDRAGNDGCGIACLDRAARSALSGLLLLAAGALLFTRLSRWRGWRALPNPIVLVLHAGYLWLAVALVLLGLSALLADATMASSGIHALTAGAVGTMTLAVMTRASLGHTGRAIETDWATAAIYALVTIGAVLRVAAPFLAPYDAILVAAGSTWSAAFALFVVRYGPMLLRPRVVS